MRNVMRIKKWKLNIILLIFVLVSTSDIRVLAAEEENIKPKIMVSLGDSYSSGEGIEPFFGQYEDIHDKIKNEDWLAHRSMESWPGMLTLPSNEGTMIENKDTYWYFKAASGAVTDNFKYAFTKTYNNQGNKGRYNLDPQLAIFDELEVNSVDYVTLTIGGNDVDFAGIIQSCVLGSTYLNIGGLSDKLDYTWDLFYANGGIKDKLYDAYESVSEKAGDQAHIIVAGYPKLIDDNGKRFCFSKEETELVNKNVSDFNDAIENIVNKCWEDGMNISFVSVENAFEGHGAYSDDSYINGIIVPSKNEDLNDIDIKSAYSMHPNKKGAKAYAECVQARIDEIEKEERIVQSQKNEMDLSENPKALESEINAKAKHFNGIILQPEDVVLKLFDSLQNGDYEKAAECLEPAVEQQIDFWGGIASTLTSLFTGKYITWGQIVLEAAGATDVEVIECYSDNYVMESNVDFISEWIPKMPGLKKLICTEADVYVKYRYEYGGEYRIKEDTCHVKRYGWAGWRIEQE